RAVRAQRCAQFRAHARRGVRGAAAGQQRKEITDGTLALGVQAVNQPGEQRPWSAAAPVGRFEEFRSRGDEREPLDAGRERCGEIERQLTAEGPAEERIALGERSERLVHPPGLRRGGACAWIPVAAPVAREIDGDDTEAWREQPYQTIPHPEVETPAVQQHEIARCTAAADFVIERAAHGSGAARGGASAPELLCES